MRSKRDEPQSPQFSKIFNLLNFIFLLLPLAWFKGPFYSRYSEVIDIIELIMLSWEQWLNYLICHINSWKDYNY